MVPITSFPRANGDPAAPLRDQLATLRGQLTALRGQLTNLRALLVLSILMTESADEEQILRLASSSASSLGDWRIAGFGIGDSWWTASCGAGAVPADLARQLPALPETGGPVTVPDAAWAWAYPLRSIAGPLGHMIACAPAEPPIEQQFLAQVVAQQTGVAVSNARLHASERRTATELARTNTALEDTVSVLRRGMQIHERLTRIAAAGEGAAGVAEALHDLTGLPVAVEDRHGNLSAWVGPGRPDPYPKAPAYDREQLLRRLMLADRSVRDGDWVVALASPRPGVLGVLALVDPGAPGWHHRRDGAGARRDRARGGAGPAAWAGRHRAAGAPRAGGRPAGGHRRRQRPPRADALGYDLGRPHRVVVVEGSERSVARDDVLHAVRRALRQQQLACLLDARRRGGDRRTGRRHGLGGGPAGHDDAAGRRALPGGRRGRLPPSGLPRSLREAQLALRLQNAASPAERTSVYADLDVFRMLAFRDFPTGKVLGAGVVDAKNLQVDSVEQIEQRIRRGLEVVPADRLLVAPDCGLGYFSRTVTYARLRNLGQAAANVRASL